MVISYHSLEDRIVKNFLKQESSTCICPPGLPQCACRQQPRLKLISKGVIIPCEAEIEANPRARSAKMRVAETGLHPGSGAGFRRSGGHCGAGSKLNQLK